MGKYGSDELFRIVDDLDELRRRDEIREQSCYGRQGIIDALEELLPPPSNRTRDGFGHGDPRWTWAKWLTQCPGSEEYPEEVAKQLDNASQILRKIIKLDVDGEILTELQWIATLFLEVSWIAQRYKKDLAPVRGTARLAKMTGTTPWCLLCGAPVSWNRARRNDYCETHDSNCNHSEYVKAVRTAESVLRHVASLEDISNHSDLRSRLLLLWREMGKRVVRPGRVRYWKEMQAEFERLSGIYSRNIQGKEIKMKIKESLGAGYTQSETARKLGISKQRVSFLRKQMKD